jgi:hypothetical protein
MEDEWARDFLIQHARDKRNDIAFVDYSVQEPFDSAWKTNARARIAQTRGTIVLVGATTYQSEAVKWEIEETIRQDHYLFGIRVNAKETHPIPADLPRRNVIRWNFDQIVRWLATWT